MDWNNLTIMSQIAFTAKNIVVISYNPDWPQIFEREVFKKKCLPDKPLKRKMK